MNRDAVEGCVFDPTPATTTVPLPGGRQVVVVDDVRSTATATRPLSGRRHAG